MLVVQTNMECSGSTELLNDRAWQVLFATCSISKRHPAAALHNFFAPSAPSRDHKQHPLRPSTNFRPRPRTRPRLESRQRPHQKTDLPSFSFHRLRIACICFNGFAGWSCRHSLVSVQWLDRRRSRIAAQKTRSVGGLMKKILPIIALISLAGCQSQRISHEEADFSQKWKSASSSERRDMIDIGTGEVTNTIRIIEGYLSGKDRETVVDFLGEPTSENIHGTLVYDTVGDAVVLVFLGDDQKAEGCTIIN